MLAAVACSLQCSSSLHEVSNTSDNSSSSPFGIPRLPRIKIGKPNRGRIVIAVVIGIIVVLFLSAKSLSSFFVNVLWHQAIGRTDVLWGILGAKGLLIGAFSLVFAILLLVNMAVADRLAPENVPDSDEQRTLIPLRTALKKRRKLVRTLLAVVLGGLIGLPAAAQWEQWLLFRNNQKFGVVDPLFNKDIGFYVFQLPFFEFLVAWAFGALVLISIVIAFLHYINGSIRLQGTDERVTAQAKVHLSVLLAGLALVRAANYWLSRFDLTRSTRGVVNGATYTDVKAQLPALNLMILVSVAVAALLLWNVRQRGWRLPVLAVGLWAIVAVAAGSVYPAIIQRFVVQPNVSTRELPYIERNLNATKAALGLTKVATENLDIAPIAAKEVSADAAPLRDVRQLDPGEMRDRFALDQGLTSFYAIRDLDVDRYKVGDRVQQVMLATRELNSAGIPNKTWVSRHLLYTHGCGIVAAPASAVTTDGRPSYIDIGVKQPQLYFGDTTLDYAITNTTKEEQPCPSLKATPYSGTTGISLGSTLRRVAMAVNFGEFNLFGSSLINDKSQILLVRDVRARVQKLAPFLTYDADPYPVVQNGKVSWVIDAFTSTSRYPYAQPANTDQLTPGGGLNHSFNYARNSVKAVVDAYTGNVTFYIVDATDPIARAWSKAFPKLFTDVKKAPATLTSHFRYPEDLFRVQTNTYAKYHFDDPTLFFNRDGAWSVAQAPPLEPEQAAAILGGSALATGTGDAVTVQDANVARFEPYYTIFHAPNSKSDVGVFSMLRPFVPFSSDDSRKELRSMMVVSSEPATYGQMTLYEFTDPLPPGPATVAAQFDSEPAISQIITPLDQRGSRVVFGDLQIIPVAKSLVYVRPLYVRPDDAAAKQVFVRKILASYDSRSVISDSVSGAIAKLFPGFSLDLGDRVGGANTSTTPDTTDTTLPGTTPTTVPGSTETTPTTVVAGIPQSPSELLAAADALFSEADAALALTPPDFATYQAKQAAARELVRRALAAVK
jgi:uncharacterized membrane protein (UPF0182 family)